MTVFIPLLLSLFLLGSCDATGVPNPATTRETTTTTDPLEQPFADVEVSIFGVGRVFEKFAEKSVRESYDKAAAFTNAWWAKHHG